MAKKSTYYRIDFINCVAPEYTYTIVENITDGFQYLEHEVEMDEHSSIKITQIKLTDKQYEKFIEECERNG